MEKRDVVGHFKGSDAEYVLLRTRILVKYADELWEEISAEEKQRESSKQRGV